MKFVNQVVQNYVGNTHITAVKMKQPARVFIAVLLAVLIAVNPVQTNAEQEPYQTPQIVSEAAVLMDAKTGQVLYQKTCTPRCIQPDHQDLDRTVGNRKRPAAG